MEDHTNEHVEEEISEDVEEPTDEEQVSEDHSEDNSEEDTEEEESQDFEFPEEPEVRKSAKDYIIERQKRKIEKLKQQEQEEEEEYDDDDDEVSSKVLKAVDPLIRKFQEAEDEKEFSATFEKYPSAKKYEKVIRKYAQSKAYQNVPIDFITKAVLHDVSAKDNARSEANQQSKSKRLGGNTKRPKEVKQKDAWQMSEEEFQRSIAQAKGRSL